MTLHQIRDFARRAQNPFAVSSRTHGAGCIKDCEGRPSKCRITPGRPPGPTALRNTRCERLQSQPAGAIRGPSRGVRRWHRPELGYCRGDWQCMTPNVPTCPGTAISDAIAFDTLLRRPMWWPRTTTLPAALLLIKCRPTRIHFANNRSIDEIQKPEHGVRAGVTTAAAGRRGWCGLGGHLPGVPWRAELHERISDL